LESYGSRITHLITTIPLLLKSCPESSNIHLRMVVFCGISSQRLIQTKEVCSHQPWRNEALIILRASPTQPTMSTSFGCSTTFRYKQNRYWEIESATYFAARWIAQWIVKIYLNPMLEGKHHWKRRRGDETVANRRINPVENPFSRISTIG
jgi:hypothetical protein